MLEERVEWAAVGCFLSTAVISWCLMTDKLAKLPEAYTVLFFLSMGGRGLRKCDLLEYDGEGRPRGDISFHFLQVLK